MKLSQIAFNWDALGERDPLGAILTGRSDPWELEAFFRSGREEVERVRARVRELGLEFGGARALDFGCGVGRLSRHLLEHYERVDGVDIAPSMLRKARELHPADDPEHRGRLRFVLNDRGDLEALEDGAYDLVFSHITLQHVPPDYTRGYLREFFRKVRPGGLVLFQLPGESHERSVRLLSGASWKQRLLAFLPGRWLERYRLFRTKRPRMNMFGLPREEVEALVEAVGGEVVATDEVDDTGGLLRSYRYFARRGEDAGGADAVPVDSWHS